MMNENRLHEPCKSARIHSLRGSLIVLLPAFFLWSLFAEAWVAEARFAEARGQESDQARGQLRKELLSRLASGNEEQRIDAITQIGALGRDDSDSDQLPVNTALGNSLQQDSSPVVRALAARALGIVAGSQGHSQSDGAAVSALTAALGKEREIAVRKAIIYALGCYPRPQVTSALIPFLKDKKREVRAATAYALAESGDPASAQALVEVLRRIAKDDDAFARSQAARGLGRIGERDAIDPLITALTRDKSQEVRREAAHALGRIATRQDANVIEALRSATLSNDPYLVTAAESAIASINARDL